MKGERANDKIKCVMDLTKDIKEENGDWQGRTNEENILHRPPKNNADNTDTTPYCKEFSTDGKEGQDNYEKIHKKFFCYL